MTELIAGLLVASLLVVGLADITRRYARTTDTVRTAAGDLKSGQLIDALLEEFARADPGSIVFAATELKARVGGHDIVARLQPGGDDALLHWSSLTTTQAFVLHSGARFERTPSGAFALRDTADGPPLAIVVPRRTLPFDCQFDTVSRECRR